MSPIIVRPATGIPLGRKGIEVILDKYQFSPGEMIHGTVRLKLKKPIQARKLTVALVGMRIVRTSGTAVFRAQYGKQQDQTFNIYNFEIPLDGENAYLSEVYTFDIKIPSDLLQSSQQPTSQVTGEGVVGVLAELAKAAETIAAANSRVEWYIEAKLDVPHNIDIHGIQQIVIS